MGRGRTKNAGAAERAGSYKVVGALYEAAHRRIGRSKSSDGYYWVPAHKGEQCLTERRRHNSYSLAYTLHENDKACDNAQEATMLKE